MAEWLTWTVNEFSLKNVDFDKFCMNGASLCAMGKDRFLDLAPDFVGDILWEHLEMLQKGKRSFTAGPDVFVHSFTRTYCGRKGIFMSLTTAVKEQRSVLRSLLLAFSL